MNRAIAAHQAGDLANAEFLYKMVLASDKKQFDATHLLGVVHAQRGQLQEALRLLSAAIRIKPNSLDALINLGGVQIELRDDQHAVTTLRRALKLDARSVLAHNNISIVLRRARQLDEALVHSEQAITLDPNYANAWNNRANILYDLKRFADAVASYDRALALDPRMAEAYLGRANVLKELGQLDQSLADYDRALSLNPNSAEGWAGRANACQWLGRIEEAFRSNDRAFTLKPQMELVEGARFRNKLQICNWENFESEQARLLEGARNGVLVMAPHDSLALQATSADIHAAARLYTSRENPLAAEPVWRGERYAHKRIRVAYLSADFREHPVAYLLAGVIGRHDRARFESIAICFTPPAESAMRTRLKSEFERFIEVDRRSDREIAELIKEMEVDIAVDLMGHTDHSRPRAFAYRPAPIQVSYLGYAGTTGADYIDYVLADRFVIPAEAEQFYTERVVCLPDTFMPTDDTRKISATAVSRTEEGLPENGFVFCSFSQSLKITPDAFAIWMRLLSAVEGSVLWLSQLNPAAVGNLRREAAAHGVAPERLVFARHVAANEGHLARHRLADLFLNTTPYNAHASAVDSLWAGVPIVTDVGTTFASRVTAGLLNTMGLPELVTSSLREYEQLALGLARDRDKLTAVRAKLAANRKTSPLFSTSRYTRHLESAYTRMWEAYEQGQPPSSFAVDAIA